MDESLTILAATLKDMTESLRVANAKLESALEDILIRNAADGIDMGVEICFECKKTIKDEVVLHCVCHKYGNAGHDGLTWCCLNCMDRDHPDEEIHD